MEPLQPSLPIYKDILSNLPRDIPYLILNRLQFADLLSAAFVSVKWNQIVGDRRALRHRFDEFLHGYRFLKIHDTIRDLGDLLAPGRVFDLAVPRYYSLDSFDPQNDNPFIEGKICGYQRFPENIKDIAVTLSIRIVKKYNDYTALDKFSDNPDMVRRIAMRRLSPDFRLDYLKEKIPYFVNDGQYANAFNLYKSILEKHQFFNLDKIYYFKFDKRYLEQFVFWLVQNKKETADVKYVKTICSQLASYDWHINDWVQEAKRSH